MPIDRLVHRELTKDLFEHGQQTVLVGLFAALILFLAFDEYITTTGPYIWFGSLFIISALRLIHITTWKYSGIDKFTIGHTRLYYLGAFAAGVAWASSIFLYSAELPLSLQILILIALVGIPSGSLATNSVHFPMFVLFALPQTLVLLHWSVFLSPSLHLHFTIATIVYSALLYGTAFKLNQTLRERFKNEILNNALLDELRTKNEELVQLAYFDPLTSIHNRRFFIEQAEECLHKMNQEANKQRAIFMLLDLDKFKTINDTLGHLAGDTYLIETAKRIKLYASQKDHSIYARLGGDEFIISYKVSDTYDVEKDAHQLMHLLLTPIMFEEHTIQPQLSVGIAEFPKDGQVISELLRDADQAMYRAKSHGSNFFVHSDQEDEHPPKTIN